MLTEAEYTAIIGRLERELAVQRKNHERTMGISYTCFLIIALILAVS